MRKTSGTAIPATSCIVPIFDKGEGYSFGLCFEASLTNHCAFSGHINCQFGSHHRAMITAETGNVKFSENPEIGKCGWPGTVELAAVQLITPYIQFLHCAYSQR
jgi:hypothetical protein